MIFYRTNYYLVPILFLLLLTSLLSPTVSAEGELPAGTVAIVNGVPIKESTLIKMVQAVAGNDASKDTPSLRQNLINELITQELLEQRALILGLNKTATAKAFLLDLGKQYTASLLLPFFREKNPLSEADIETEYKRRIALNKENPVKEYKLNMIIVKSYEDANNALSALTDQPFDTVANELSLNKSSEGGAFGWVQKNQIIPEVFQVLENLSVGQLSYPIKSQLGWHILKVDEVRQARVLTLEVARPMLTKGLMNIKIQSYLAKLRAKAKITQ